MSLGAYNKTTWVNNQTPVNASNMNHIEDAVEENRNEIITHDANISGLTLRMQTAEGKISTLEDRSATAGINIGDLQLRMQTAEGNIGSLQTGMTTAREDIDTLQDQAGSDHLNTTAQTLSGAVNELDGELLTAQNDVNALQNTTLRLTNLTDSLDRRVTAIESGNIDDITARFSSSNTRVTIEKAYKCGSVICVWVQIARTASWANGSSGDISATITTDFIPLLASTAVLAWGSGSIIGQFGGQYSHMNPGEMVFRNVSGSSISTSTTNPVNMYFEYVFSNSN